MRILIQAGHKGRMTGAIGAPGEKKWTGEIVPMIAQRLRDKGFEVGECNADPTDADIAGDWALFLAVHYDADIYNDRGGFIDIPDKSVDLAHEESKRIAEIMRRAYFNITGIPEHPERSNKNTKFYYMWNRMSEKTPCVILEAGIGFRTTEDHKTLHFQKDKVADAVVAGIVNALGEQKPEEKPEEPEQNCEEKAEDVLVESEIKAEIEVAGFKWGINGIEKQVGDYTINYKKIDKAG